MELEGRIQLIVVGCGKWGTNLIKTAHSLGNLVAIVDSNETSLKSLFQRHPPLSNIPTFLKLSEALTAYSNAAVIVATPPKTHYCIGMEALRADRHLFVEKPICDSLTDARILVSEAKKRNLILIVDHLLQYSLSHRRLIHLVSTGYVGNVTRVRMCRLNFGTIRTVEDVLWSFCPHDLSILLALMRGGSKIGEGQKVYPTSVTCQGQALVSSNITDYVDICVTFSSGARAHVEASWLHPMKERRVIVYGSEGSVVLNEGMPDKTLPKLQTFKWSTKRRHDGSAVDIEKSSDDMADHLQKFPEDDVLKFSSESQPLRSVLEYFIHCASQDIPASRSDGDEALSVLALLDAASQSLQKGGISIPFDQAGTENNVTSNQPLNGKVEAGNVSKEDKSNENTDSKNELQNKKYFVHETAIVDKGAAIGDGTKVWHFSHVMGGAKIGPNCNIGQNVYIGSDVSLGYNVKVQNNVSIYDAVHIDDDVFLGPSCVFTNVKTPRSHISRKHMYSPSKLEKGVTVGANATIICGITLGRYCFIGAGAVVTKDVTPHALVYGNPARIEGWVSTTGIKLLPSTYEEEDTGNQLLECPESGETYLLKKGKGDEKDILNGPLKK